MRHPNIMIPILDGLRSKHLYRRWTRLYFVIEKADWIIKRVGEYVSKYASDSFNMKSKVITDSRGIGDQILHFGSRGLYLPESWKSIDRTNRVVFTWFHGKAEDTDPINQAMIKALPTAAEICRYIHTTNDGARRRFLDWGIPEEKIVVIPLGVDLDLFKPVSTEDKRLTKKQLGIPEQSICIGSFQKDGVGWNEGTEPKLVKGPDILCEALIKLSKIYPIYVLLLGPARGYVKRRLEDAEIPYYHRYVEKYEDIPKHYHALDLYLVTSRDEGGPNAITECLAAGVPIVATNVGMAGDVIVHGQNGYLADVENVDEIVGHCSKIIENDERASAIVSAGLRTAQAYSWKSIAGLYYEKMYSYLLE